MEYQKVPLPGWLRELGTRYSAVSKATGNSTRVFIVSTEGKRERMKGVKPCKAAGHQPDCWTALNEYNAPTFGGL